MGMMAFMANVAKGLGLPTHLTYSAERIHELRAHLVTIILLASLDPPKDPYRTRIGLQQIMAPGFCWPDQRCRSEVPNRHRGGGAFTNYVTKLV